jgi:uncharacterized protein (TIGR03905 family)
VRHTVKPKKICPKELSFDLDDGQVRNIRFTGGCNGNLQGISRLCEGKDALEVARLLSGVVCGKKISSCPDELSRALFRALGKKPPKRQKPPEGPAAK